MNSRNSNWKSIESNLEYKIKYSVDVVEHGFTEHEIQFISFAQSRSIDSYNNKNQNKQTKEAKTTTEFYQIDATLAHTLLK